jgi:hypothetical protein
MPGARKQPPCPRTSRRPGSRSTDSHSIGDLSRDDNRLTNRASAAQGIVTWPVMPAPSGSHRCQTASPDAEASNVTTWVPSEARSAPLFPLPPDPEAEAPKPCKRVPAEAAPLDPLPSCPKPKPRARQARSRRSSAPLFSNREAQGRSPEPHGPIPPKRGRPVGPEPQGRGAEAPNPRGFVSARAALPRSRTARTAAAEAAETRAIRSRESSSQRCPRAPLLPLTYPVGVTKPSVPERTQERRQHEHTGRSGSDRKRPSPKQPEHPSETPKRLARTQPDPTRARSVLPPKRRRLSSRMRGHLRNAARPHGTNEASWLVAWRRYPT